MRTFAGMTRILIALLVFRMLCAPVTARPVTAKTASNAGFIVRVCAWPAQRPEQLESTVLLARRSGGSGVPPVIGRMLPSRLHAIDPLARATLLSLTPRAPSVRLTDVPRC